MNRYIAPILYILLLLVGCLSFIAIAGVRIGVFESLTGFNLLKYSVIASLVLSLMAIGSCFFCKCEKGSGRQRFFYLVVFLPLFYSVFWISCYVQKSGLPEISDITTDFEHPPVFINVPFLRKSTENSTEYNPEWAPIQQEYYPDIKPVYYSLPKSEVFLESLQLVADNGWELIAKYPAAGMIEATARTPIFGFREDVVIRISDEKNGVRVDMRSCSREGRGDFGENARRISGFFNSLNKSLEQPRLVSYAN
mgnify:CR=1 FL=1